VSDRNAGSRSVSSAATRETVAYSDAAFKSIESFEAGGSGVIYAQEMAPLFTALLARLAAAEKALEALGEWGTWVAEDQTFECSACLRYRSQGHKDDCPLRAWLDLLEESAGLEERGEPKNEDLQEERES